MGVHFPSVATTTFIGPLPANATETIIMTTPPINLSIDNAQVLIFWAATFLIGATITSLVFRLRRGALITSALVFAAVWTQTVTAANNAIVTGNYPDVPGAVAGQQYSLTVVQTAATGSSTFNDGALLAMVL